MTTCLSPLEKFLCLFFTLVHTPHGSKLKRASVPNHHHAGRALVGKGFLEGRIRLPWEHTVLMVPPHSQQVETQTLTMFRDIAQQLQSTCASLGSSIQGLPTHVKDQLQQARHQVEGLQATFSGIHSFQDLSSTVLMQSREQVAKAREALDHMVEYVAQNTPITWLVGPFAPGVVEKAPEEKK